MNTSSLIEPQIKPCPAWCTHTPGHGWDSIQGDGRRSRDHGGPTFGPHISGGSTEMENGEHSLNVFMWCDGLDLNSSELLDLAANALAAAEWLESVQ